jgi:hypothetical protein
MDGVTKCQQKFFRQEPSQRMTDLCSSIPALRGMLGTDPWDAIAIANQYPILSSGERAVVQFVLYVWDGSTVWRRLFGIEPFDTNSFAALDIPNQRAIAKWFADPFWP